MLFAFALLAYAILDSAAWWLGIFGRRNRDDLALAGGCLIIGAAILFVRRDSLEAAFVFPWMRRGWFWLWQPRRKPAKTSLLDQEQTLHSCLDRRVETVKEVRFAAAMLRRKLEEDEKQWGWK